MPGICNASGRNSPRIILDFPKTQAPQDVIVAHFPASDEPSVRLNAAEINLFNLRYRSSLNVNQYLLCQFLAGLPRVGISAIACTSPNALTQRSIADLRRMSPIGKAERHV